jgi:DNA-binding transcriptional ArsR family regulator
VVTNAAQVFSALHDPTRRAVLERLRAGPAPVGEIARELPVTRPAVSQHLQVLKRAGLVGHRTQGTKRIYYIDPKGLGAIRRWLDELWDAALFAFAEEVERGTEQAREQE